MTHPAPKFSIHEIVDLNKQGKGKLIQVRIEGISQHILTDTIYNVREIETQIGYPAGESDLRKIKVVK